jgi:hypothetical protein
MKRAFDLGEMTHRALQAHAWIDLRQLDGWSGLQLRLYDALQEGLVVVRSILQQIDTGE